MELRDYLRVARRQGLLIVVFLLLGLLGGRTYTSEATKSYQAEAKAFVAVSPHTVQVYTLAAGSQFILERISSYAQLGESSQVLDSVISSLGLHESAAQLASHVTVSNPALTVVLDVLVTDSQPARASAIADGVATKLSSLIETLETSPGGVNSPITVTVTQASVPTTPIEPRASLDEALGLAIGLVVGVALAVFRMRVDFRLRTVRQVERLVGAAPLGTLRRSRRLESGALGTAGRETRKESEELQLVRSSIQLANGGVLPRSLVVTSADYRARTTELACNLAIVAAQSGLRVCIIEAQLRRPKLASYLRLAGRGSSTDGLAQVLAGRRGVGEVLIQDGVRGITVLPAGKGVADASGLLAAPAMTAVLEELSSRHDLVVIVAPALLPLPDARLIAQRADGVVVAVRYGRTTERQLHESMLALRQAGGRLLGTVWVNARRPASRIPVFR
jgi:capsular polysaccharide biosynthesis protein